MSVSKQNYFYSIGCTLLRNKQSGGGFVLLKPFLIIIIIIIIITCLLAQLHIIYQQQQRGRYLRSLLLIGYWICAVSSSSIRVVHDQKWIVTGIIDKRQFPKTKNKVYSWRGPPWTMMRSSKELVYRPQWSHPWTSSVDDNEEWTIQLSIQRTDE